MKTIQCHLEEAIFKRIQERMWKNLNAKKFNRDYAKLAAQRFLDGTLNHDDVNVLGMPLENSGSTEGALRWLATGVGDKHMAAINSALSQFHVSRVKQKKGRKARTGSASRPKKPKVSRLDQTDPAHSEQSTD